MVSDYQSSYSGQYQPNIIFDTEDFFDDVIDDSSGEDVFEEIWSFPGREEAEC